MVRSLWIRVFGGLVLALAMTAVPAGRFGHAQQSVPALHFTKAAGFQLGVSGQGWPHRGRLNLVVRSGASAAGLRFRSTSAGTFLLGINSVDVCSGVRFDVYTRSGRHAQIQTPQRGCPSVGDPSVPVVTVLQGTVLRPSEARLLALQTPAGPFHLRVGQTLYFWLPGTLRPAFVPKTNPAYLVLVTQGTTAARACAQPDCSAGFFWRWLAVQSGTTAIDLSPACRQSKPQCEIADRLIEVTIDP
jgi:hypothetical protein